MADLEPVKSAKVDCNNCYEINWDGWAPHFGKKLIAHLKKEGIPIPERNEDGWLPRDGEQ